MQGFQAFAPNASVTQKVTKGKRKAPVAYEPVEEPETGIHSLAWANAIAPQESAS